ncbi:hypothetical protein NAPIS_ORF00530 [Vairimorpha apis BRL 01]|uniref:Uncharacterized protein n=1 Tax=Vairimorpha apis BRL 01 TaxID=1037528 RepID=T0MFP9_9MICR|nr:hypothetical protein NAPIS_ORF00530 [Vairimorpha apis BRL 01]
MLNDRTSYETVKKNILTINCNTNNNFDICFIDKSNIKIDIDNFKYMSLINENYIYNLISKQLVDMCSLLMLNIDKIYVLLFNLQFYCKYSLNLFSNYIYYYLKEYVLINKRTRNVNNKNISLIESYLCLKN